MISSGNFYTSIFPHRAKFFIIYTFTFTNKILLFCGGTLHTRVCEEGELTSP